VSNAPEPPDIEDARPTIPDHTHAYVTLPLTPARAERFARIFADYATVCADVKRALEVQDAGEAYTLARERKHAQHARVIAEVESVLAYIGVHAP
jgi:hypothetical protein